MIFDLRPVWAIASEVRWVVDPASIEGEVVHYNIPALEATGEPTVEAAGEIKSGKLLLRGGEVLISRLNPRKSRVVRTLPANLPILASTEFVPLRPVDCDPRFLTYCLLSESTRQSLDSQVRSVTRSHQRVDPSHVTRLAIPAPPVNEQRRIADFLDDQIARLDRAVRQRRMQLGNLAERTLASVSDLLAPPTRSGTGQSQYPWLSAESDPLTKLSSVCRLQSGVTVDASRTTGVEYPYLRVANVQNGSINLDEVKRIVVPIDVARRSRLRAGDVLMTEGGDIDKLGRGSVWHGEINSCLHQNHVFALRPDTSALLPEYLAAVTRTHHARCYFESTGSQSTNLASTNSTKVLAFRFPMPSLAVQKVKLREVWANDETADRLGSALRRQIDLLVERKNALITAAVTGQIDVTTARTVA